MRLSELINIKIKDIDIYNSSLKVLGKRNKERIIPVLNQLNNFIKAYLESTHPCPEHNSSYLITTEKGKKVYPKLVYRTVNSYLSKITTADKKSPHVLRHTFATHMLDNGSDLNAIKELLGHANLSATQVYTHNTIEKLKSIYKQAHPRA
jgi:integrase/recombinase XerC